MNTATDDALPVFTLAENKELKKDDDGKIIIPYKYRSMFRPKLQEFFSTLEKLQGYAKQGTYIWAEELAKEWFRVNYNIPFEGWEYRK